MFPAAVSFLLTMTWRHALWIMSAVGIAVAAGLALFLPTTRDHSSTRCGERWTVPVGAAFPFVAIGVLDTAVRMELLMFLPFLLKAKGASLSVTDCRSMLFIGAMAKFIADGSALMPR
jgi:hypothetical protein